MKAGIIGFGNIGSRLYAELLENGWSVSFILTSKYVFTGGDLSTPKDQIQNWVEYCQNVDVVFLAIPTLDDGSAALHYIKTLTALGIRVVTCEKGSVSNFFAEFQSILNLVNFSTSVGGNSGMIAFLEEHFFSGTSKILAIVNSTLNFIWYCLAAGIPLGLAIEKAKGLGYVEPGAVDVIGIVLGEACSDVTKKAVILFNSCLSSGTFLRAKDIKVVLTEELIRLAISKAMTKRFVVSFDREGSSEEEPDVAISSPDVIAFDHFVDGWVITGGWRDTSDSMVSYLCESAPDANNALLMIQGEDGVGGTNLCAGQGAGPSVISVAMRKAAEKFL